MKRETSDLGFVRGVFAFEDAAPLFDNIEWVDGDLLDVLRLEELMQGCEVVYHCAASVSFAKKDEERLMEVNIGGTANVVNACLASGVKKTELREFNRRVWQGAQPRFGYRRCAMETHARTTVLTPSASTAQNAKCGVAPKKVSTR